MCSQQAPLEVRLWEAVARPAQDQLSPQPRISSERGGHAGFPPGVRLTRLRLLVAVWSALSREYIASHAAGCAITVIILYKWSSSGAANASSTLAVTPDIVGARGDHLS